MSQLATLQKALKTAAAKTPPPRYTPPAVEQGEYVLWTPDYDTPLEQATLAVVTTAHPGADAIDLNIICPGSATMLPRTGVPHAGDAKQRIVNVNQGCWHKRPSSPEVLRQRVEDLSIALGDTQELLLKTTDMVNKMRGQLMNVQKALKLKSPEELPAEPPTGGSQAA